MEKMIHPVPYTGTKKVPGEKALTRWLFDGVAKAEDGCKVEPDGVCPHGRKSWLMILGYI